MFPRLQPADIFALIVASAFFMEGLDATIIAPAIPQMAQAFGTTSVALSAGISTYLITVAIFVPTSRWVAERYGVRNVFCGAIVLFTIASVLCGLSTNLGEFTLARVLQGIGGAMMSPVGRAEVLRRSERHNFMRATALVTWPGLSAFIVGPPLGGLITTYVSWNWIFFVNIPIGIAGLALVLRYFDNAKGPRRPFDVAGFFLNGGSLAILMYGLDLLGHRRADWTIGAGLIAGGIILGVVAVLHARRHDHPLVSLTSLRMRTFSIGTLWAGFPFRMVVGAGGFLLPTMFQVGFGYSALISGLLVLAYAVGDLGIKFRTTAIVRRFTFRSMLIGNGLLVALTTLYCAAFTPDTSFWIMVPALVLFGASRSLQFTGLSSVTYADIPHDEIGNATTMFSMVHQVALGLGIAISAIILNLSSTWHGGGIHEPAANDFRVAIFIMAALAFVPVAAYLKLDPLAGAAVSGHSLAARTAAAGKTEIAKPPVA